MVSQLYMMKTTLEFFAGFLSNKRKFVQNEAIVISPKNLLIRHQYSLESSFIRSFEDSYKDS